MKKYLIISDTHLSHIFVRSKFLFLQQALDQCDQAIINGDFWEGFLSSFDQFINSPWQDLFPLMKKKEAIYLYGNHDPEERSDERRSYFSVKQGSVTTFRSGGLEFRIEHGHRISPSLGGNRPLVPRFILGIPPRIEAKRVRLPDVFHDYNQRNNKIKQWIQAHLPAPEILVCGHSHRAEISLSERFANSGSVKWRRGQYLLVTNGAVELQTQRF